MASLKKGDVVKLKSGGPPMTVTTVQVTGLIFCTWFTKEQTTPNTVGFEEDALRPLKPGEY